MPWIRRKLKKDVASTQQGAVFSSPLPSSPPPSSPSPKVPRERGSYSEWMQKRQKKEVYLTKPEDEPPNMRRSVSCASSCSSAGSAASRNSRSGRRSRRQSRNPRRVKKAGKAVIKMPARSSSGSRSRSYQATPFGFYECTCCPAWTKVFSSPEALDAHELEELEISPFRCTECTLRYESEGTMLRHRYFEHLRGDEWSCFRLRSPKIAFESETVQCKDTQTNLEIFDVCGYCGMQFPILNYHCHLEEAHGSLRCDETYYLFGDFRQHLMNSHAATPNPVMDSMIDRAHKTAPGELLVRLEQCSTVERNNGDVSDACALPEDDFQKDSDVKQRDLLSSLYLKAFELISHPVPTIDKFVTLYQVLIRWCRPRPRRNHSRLEWHCRCGQQFWGDFESDEPENLHRLVSDLQQHGFAVDTTTKTTTASGTPATTGTTTSSQNATTGPSAPSPNASQVVKHGTPATPSGTTSPAVRQATMSAPITLRSIGKPVYLELCVNRSSRVTQLGEITIVDGRGQQLINTDLELFASIRAKYNSIKRKGLFALLYQPSDIHYVQFGTQPSAQQTDIYQKPEALPPHTEVIENRYHYHECPLTPLPPMPPQTFYQYFRQHAPNCASRSTLFSDRLPKKLGASMTLQNGADKLEFGWGIHIIEGPNKSVLAILVAVIVASSFVISIIYDVCTGNADSGFAIGQWIVAVLSAVLSAVYFHLQDQ